MVELKPCPFCGGAARIESNRDWHRLFALHDDDCVFDADDHDLMYPAQPGYLIQIAEDWNRRTTPPSPSTAPTVEVDERAAFEAWGQGRVTSLIQGKFGTGYVYADTARAWEAWQARAALASKPPAREAAWGPVKTVGDMVRNLMTLDQAAPIFAAFHTDLDGKRVCRTRPIIISRERVIDGKWVDSSRKDVPYANIVWAKQDECAESPAREAAVKDSLTTQATIKESLQVATREAAERQSIDTPEFEDLVSRVGRGEAKLCHLIAHIDTWGGRSTDERERELCAKMGAMQAQIDQFTADIVASRSAGDAVPDVLFDGKAVYDEIVRKVGKAYCGSPSVVADALDAVVRLIRRGAAPAPGNTERSSG